MTDKCVIGYLFNRLSQTLCLMIFTAGSHIIRGRETSLEQVAPMSFISIVVYIIYAAIAFFTDKHIFVVRVI